MAVLFVSHSSKDDAAALGLEAWLRVNGFTDVFIDHGSIPGGAKWREELRASAGACQVVVCLVSENWLASYECFNEFRAAWYMGKRIIPLLSLPSGSPSIGEESKQRFDEVCAEDQGIDIGACISPNGLLDLSASPTIEKRLMSGLRAAGALSRVGLDPEAFEIDRKLRPTPFPGLSSFGDDDADAALFHGRSREIAHAMEELRKMRAERDLRPFVILGASGAGKSSLLRAGIIPRLRRETPAWLPLHAFRPGANPLLNFAEAMAQSLSDFGKAEVHGVLRDRLFEAWSKAERDGDQLTPAGQEALEAALEFEGNKLRDASGLKGASILISVDQAEEMARAEGDSSDALADYLRVALGSAASRWQLAFTIRSDSFPELQSHRRFQNLEARGYDLRAIPTFRFDTVVEEPARRYGVSVEPALVDALMEDAPREDALPLLAFALQRLWRQYAGSGVLTRDNYEKVGGLRGIIEDAAERALRGLSPAEDTPLPSGPPTRARVAIAASAFVPALAQINDQGATIRRIAALDSFSDEQQDLLVRFEQWRLVVRRGEAGTIEVAHEALFREWSRLQSWLEPERARLEALRSFQSDASAWDRNDRDVAFLNHRHKRLAETDALTAIEDYRKRLGVIEFGYLAACHKAERAARWRTRRMELLVGTLVAALGAGLAVWQYEQPLREEWKWLMVTRPYMLAQVRPYVLTAETERALKPGATFRECAKDCAEMIVIPAGSFLMGSLTSEGGRYVNEGPQHEVSIVKPLAVSRFDVTFADWDACVSAGGCPHANDSGMGRGTKPVINVNWDEAQTYVTWFSKMTGKPYRLLTEAEWEYAARAGTTTAYPWGDLIGTGHADCNECGSEWDARETSPVGSFRPNGFGLYDMAGDVFQWVQDCYSASYDKAPTDGAVSPAVDCSRHIVRGGSWAADPRALRSANRGGSSTVSRVIVLGFRLARTLGG